MNKQSISLLQQTPKDLVDLSPIQSTSINKVVEIYKWVNFPILCSSEEGNILLRDAAR